MKATARLFLGMFALSSFGLAGQERDSVLLRVSDAFSGKPIAAVVNVSGLAKPTAIFETGEDGFIKLKFDSAATISVAAEGYRNYQSALTISQSILLEPLRMDLGPAEVTAYDRTSGWLNQSRETASISGHLLALGDQTSLRQAVNFLPGVEMNERGYGGSRRFSIRGSLVRSPFGVRGIRFYRDGFALTNPDGTTSLELTDPSEVSGITVIKSAAGSIYGSGQGGVVLIEPLRPVYLRQAAEMSILSGEFGQWRAVLNTNAGWQRAALRVSIVTQQTAGYRDQEANEKDHIIIDARGLIGERDEWVAYLNHFNGFWELPGGLTASEADSIPRSALPFAELNRTEVTRTHDYAGLGINLNRGRLTNRTRIYFHYTEKVNPFGTNAFNSGCKKELATGSGLRSVFNYRLMQRDSAGLQLLFGTELQGENWHITEGSLENGLYGQTRYTVDAFSSNAMLFAELQWTYFSLRVNGGLSYQMAGFNAEGYSTELDIPLNHRFRYTNPLAPGLRVVWKGSETVSVSASHSRGFNYPGVFELVDTGTGYLNRGLTSERSSSTEFGAAVDNGPVRLAASVFRTDFSDLILPDTDEAERISYRNIGRSQNKGAEISGTFLLWEVDSGAVRVMADLTGGVNAFIFRQREGDKMQPLAGIPAHTAAAALRVELFDLVEITFTDQWRDRTPLNDDLTNYAAAYHLMMAQLGVRRNWRKLNFRIHAGVNNLGDAQYSSFLQLNNPAGRYFNPSPGRNFFGGLCVGWMLG